MIALRTARLLLRPWRDADLDPFFEMSNDREVMSYFPSLLDREQCAALIGRVRDHFRRHGWGLWAVEVHGGPSFVGFCGLQHVPFEAAFTPAVEIGWRLARAAWGHGYATEGARAALAFAWNQLHLDEVVAMVVPDNARSIAVMDRLGMTRDLAADFDHPRIPDDVPSVGGYAMRRHALYRLRRGTSAA